MIRIEQIQLLEKKIDKAVELINLLKKENQTLKNAIQKSQTRMSELEHLLEQFKGEQSKIEEGLISALSKLDRLEDEVADTSEIKKKGNADNIEEVEISPKIIIDENPINPEESASTDNQASESEDPQEKEIELDIF